MVLEIPSQLQYLQISKAMEDQALKLACAHVVCRRERRGGTAFSWRAWNQCDRVLCGQLKNRLLYRIHWGENGSRDSLSFPWVFILCCAHGLTQGIFTAFLHCSVAEMLSSTMIHNSFLLIGSIQCIGQKQSDNHVCHVLYFDKQEDS